MIRLFEFEMSEAQIEMCVHDAGQGPVGWVWMVRGDVGADPLDVTADDCDELAQQFTEMARILRGET